MTKVQDMTMTRDDDHFAACGAPGPVVSAPAVHLRRNRGQLAWQAGYAAEDIISRQYEARGATILERRWRGPAGEIDLVVSEGNCIVFVEVKKAATHFAAGARISRRQMDRIAGSAAVYISRLPDGQETMSRFDAGLVDGWGRAEIVENAFWVH